MDEFMKALAVELIDPDIDIYFQLNDGATFLDDKNVQLIMPEVNRLYEDEVSTSEIAGSVDELIKYYREVVRAAVSHGEQYSVYSHMFWLRLKILDNSKVAKYTFSYLDTLEDIQTFQEWVNRNENNSHYGNGDQGWEFAAFNEAGNIYMHEEDGFHDGDIESNFFISQSFLSDSLNSAYIEAREIIESLTGSLGVDVWSQYKGYPSDSVVFGTTEWDPYKNDKEPENPTPNGWR